MTTLKSSKPEMAADIPELIRDPSRANTCYERGRFLGKVNLKDKLSSCQIFHVNFAPFFRFIPLSNTCNSLLQDMMSNTLTNVKIVDLLRFRKRNARFFLVSRLLNF